MYVPHLLIFSLSLGTNTAVMHMWGEQTAMPMHSLHLAFGVGALSAPQIARPFLGESQDPEEPVLSTHVQTKGLLTNLIDANNVTTQTPNVPGKIVDDSSIEYSFMIVGVATCLLALVYLPFHFLGFPKGFPERQPTRLSLSMCSPTSCGRGSFYIGLLYLILLFFFFFHAGGGELAYATYIYSFAVEKENPLSTDDAANLNTVFFACFTCGRGLGILISKFLSTDTMILIDVLMYVPSSIVLLLWGYENDIILWIFSGLTGLFISIFFPAGMAWANTYLDVNGMLVMVLVVGANGGVLTYKYATGALFDSEGPESLMYVNFAAAVFMVIFYGIMYVATFRKRRSKK